MISLESTLHNVLHYTNEDYSYRVRGKAIKEIVSSCKQKFILKKDLNERKLELLCSLGPKYISSAFESNHGHSLRGSRLFASDFIEDHYDNDDYFSVILLFCDNEVLLDYLSGIIIHKDSLEEDSLRMEFIIDFYSKLSKNIDTIDYEDSHFGRDHFRQFLIVLSSYISGYNLDYVELIKSAKDTVDRKAFERVGLSKSRDPELYMYLFKQIKRSEGYQERRTEVVTSCIENMAFDDDCIKVFSSKLTKAYQRQVAHIIEEKIKLKKRQVSGSEESDNSHKDDLLKLQRLATNFIISNDKHWEVINTLFSCVGVQNALFIAPIVADNLGHYNLIKFKRMYKIGE